MKKYIALGHFKGKTKESITSIVITQVNKKAALNDCYGNEFVPFVVITEEAFYNLDSGDVYNVFQAVKKMTTNYRVWDLVAQYLVDCRAIIIDNLNKAWQPDE